ncbi:hypothetical protein ACFUIW_36650 [Streptomyces sp. NPDC057245]|uniref:hypothetical protein n=1 Tax=Streptomyces TaxID=1883 RepID=UPI001C1DEDBA|nr:hypothetical protein [Streptomyces sp. A108]MBU6532961.1 hypothetical protein [Streptomyces sp. A108]
MRKFQRAAVAAVGLLAFAGITTQSAQAAQADPSPRGGGYVAGTYGSWSACNSAAQRYKNAFCDENGKGGWWLMVVEDSCKQIVNSTPAQASTKDGISTRGC